MDAFLDTFFWMTLLAASIRIASPIVFASLGEVLAEKAGFLNIGIEGMMTMGAWAAFMGAYYTGDPWLGILIGAIGGGLVALVAAFISITRGADQIVTGIVINIFCLGVTSLTYKKIFEATADLPSVHALRPLRVPVLSEVPFLGPVLFQHIPLVYIALLLAPIFSIFLYRTALGLKVRAVGEHPRAADTAGIDVHRIRYFAIIVGGVMAGLGGGPCRWASSISSWTS
ncbi:MAG: ABC transporter permease [Nitrospinota bacterium]